MSDDVPGNGRTAVEERAAVEEFGFDRLMRGRRSVRRYAPQPVSDAVIREVLDLARHAPSSMDGQPWCFVVVRDPDTLRRLAAIKNDHCSAEKRPLYPADFVASAPVVVAVCVEDGRAHGRGRESGVLAAAHLLLAAHARGLGGVYLTAYQAEDPALERALGELLGLPPEIQPVALVPLGYPAEAPAAKELRLLDEIIHHEAYGGRAG